MKTLTYYTFFERTIIENIDFESYGLDNDVYLYDKIKTTYNIFVREYGHEIKRRGELHAFKEWLQGLPSVLTVPFENYKIILNAEVFGNYVLNTEEKEDEFLDTYWLNLAKAFFTLKNNL